MPGLLMLLFRTLMRTILWLIAGVSLAAAAVQSPLPSLDIYFIDISRSVGNVSRTNTSKRSPSEQMR